MILGFFPFSLALVDDKITCLVYVHVCGPAWAAAWLVLDHDLLPNLSSSSWGKNVNIQPNLLWFLNLAQCKLILIAIRLQYDKLFPNQKMGETNLIF